MQLYSLFSAAGSLFAKVALISAEFSVGKTR